ncbi:hypothetical protein ACIBO5_54460 [Nonomuraea angiospora]|uniref:hypothetical protein n=1 Tax=Nonomuraea angiospora TaxID=46172 RepID=UPI00378B6516
MTARPRRAGFLVRAGSSQPVRTPAVAWVDARDIAGVAVAALSAPEEVGRCDGFFSRLNSDSPSVHTVVSSAPMRSTTRAKISALTRAGS